MKEPVWIHPEFVCVLHEELIAEFGGSVGIRDRGLLESALTRPKNLFGYGDPSLADLAASYAVGIVKNHPFIDGNKRTGFMVAYTFLIRNGCEFVASESTAAAAVIALAANELTEAGFAEWLKGHCRT